MTDAAVTLLVFISILMVCVAAGWAIWAIASGTDLLEKFREPSFPCAKCVHFTDGCDDKRMTTYGGRCIACFERITGEPQNCSIVRASRQCARNAKEVR